jgi:acetyl-CoA decarbonylase/synthase complex subunit beta
MGIPFSTMAGQCSGGKQVEGFIGLSIEYMKSPKFLQADGGYERIVWIPKELKDSLVDFIPSELYTKIPTEEDAETIEDIRNFLVEAEHPIMGRINQNEEFTDETEVIEESNPDSGLAIGDDSETPVAYLPELSVPGSDGVRIILKNAKVYAEKVIIKKEQK